MSNENMEGRIVALRSLCVVLLDQHCRDRRINSNSVTSSSVRPASEEAAEGYDAEIGQVLQQLNDLRRAKHYRTG